MLPSSLRPQCGLALAVGAAGMALASLSGEISGLLAVFVAIHICGRRYLTMLSIGIGGIAIVLFFLLPGPDLPPDIKVYLRFTALTTVVIAIGLLIRDKERVTSSARSGRYGTKIDDQKNAEKFSSSSEVQLRQLLDALPALVWSTTPQGELCYSNKRMMDYTGLTLDSLAGAAGGTQKALAMQALVHPDDLADLEQLCSDSFQAGEPIRTRYRLRRADNVYRWVDARVEPFRDPDGRIVQWYGVCVDIDDSQKAEAALRDSEADLRSILDNVPGMIATADPNGRLDYANKRDLDYFRVEMSDLAGHNFINVIHPEDREATMTAWLHAVQTGEPTDFHHRFRRHDGIYRQFNSRVEPAFDRHGKVARWYGLFTDVDERQRAEDALRNTERQLRLFIDAVPALVWCATPEGDPSYLNKRMIDFTGIALESFDPLQDGDLGSLAMHAVIHPDDLADQQRLRFDSFQAGEPIRTRFRLRRADGVYRWVDARVDPFRDADGNIVQWYGVCVDIDDSQKAEAALRDSEQQLRLLVDTIPALVWCASPNGAPYYFNKRLTDYTGATLGSSDLSADESRPSPTMRALYHSDDIDELRRRWFHCVRTGEAFRMSYRLRRADGVYRWVDSRAEPLYDRDGRIVRWYGVFADVDERQRAEEALRSTERQLRLLIDAIPALVWCATPDGEPSYLNKRMIDFTGLPLDSFEPLEGGSVGSLARLAIVHPDDLDELEQLWSHSVQTGAALSMRHRLRRVDGAYHWVDLRAEPLRNDGGDIVQWYGVCVDIEVETRIQDELRAAHAKLARASQAAGLAELSASIAHEVNQSLAAVIANSHACQRWLSTEPPNLQRARVTLERIIRDANGAAEVVCGIRALFKQTVSTRDAINLNEVITEVCKLIGDDVARKNIGIEIDLERGLPSTLVDRVQMQQVLVNLTRNGIDAMETSTEHPKSLLIRSRRDGMNKVLVEVRDRGNGVEDVERIFEPFFTTKENGMGMGLAICRSIIEAHDGHLWAAKNELRGTTFTFTLPAYSGVSQ